jgi:quinol monooxygenase YgiN
MPNLPVVAVITVKPGSEQIVETALKALAAASRGDDGCVSYELFASASAPATFVTIEEWESQEDIDAHMASSHMVEAINAFGEYLDGFPAIHTLRPLEP